MCSSAFGSKGVSSRRGASLSGGRTELSRWRVSTSISRTSCVAVGVSSETEGVVSTPLFSDPNDLDKRGERWTDGGLLL